MDGSYGIIFNNSAEVLLVLRRDMPIWVLPGGGIELNETPEQAAVREVFEETGFIVNVVKKVGEYSYKGSLKINHTFLCVVKKGTITLSNESKAIQYFAVDRLPINTSPYLLKMISDSQLDSSAVIKHMFPKLSKTFWMKSVLHPWALFKYLLTRIGIHWNI